MRRIEIIQALKFQLQNNATILKSNQTSYSLDPVSFNNNHKIVLVLNRAIESINNDRISYYRLDNAIGNTIIKINRAANDGIDYNDNYHIDISWELNEILMNFIDAIDHGTIAYDDEFD